MSSSMVSMMMMLLMVGGGYYLYKSGKLDELFKKKEGGGGGADAGGAPPCDCSGAADTQAAEPPDDDKKSKKSKIAYAWSAEMGDWVAYASKSKKSNKKSNKKDKKKDDKDGGDGADAGGDDPMAADPCAEQCKSGGGDAKTKTKAGSSEANLVAIAAQGENVWMPRQGSVKFRSYSVSAIPATGNLITNSVFPNHKRSTRYDSAYSLMNMQ